MMGSIKLDGNTLTSTELSLVSMGEKVEVASLGENLGGVLQVTMEMMHFVLNALRLNPNRLFQRWEEAGVAIRL